MASLQPNEATVAAFLKNGSIREFLQAGRIKPVVYDPRNPTIISSIETLPPIAPPTSPLHNSRSPISKPLSALFESTPEYPNPDGERESAENLPFTPLSSGTDNFFEALERFGNPSGDDSKDLSLLNFDYLSDSGGNIQTRKRVFIMGVTDIFPFDAVNKIPNISIEYFSANDNLNAPSKRTNMLKGKKYTSPFFPPYADGSYPKDIDEIIFVNSQQYFKPLPKSKEAKKQVRKFREGKQLIFILDAVTAALKPGGRLFLPDTMTESLGPIRIEDKGKNILNQYFTDRSASFEKVEASEITKSVFRIIHNPTLPSAISVTKVETVERKITRRRSSTAGA